MLDSNENDVVKTMNQRIEAIKAENKLREELKKENEAKTGGFTIETTDVEGKKETVEATPIASKPFVLGELVALRDAVNTAFTNKENAAVDKIRREANASAPSGETQKQRILREHGGQISNVPINSPYWRLKR